MVCVLAIMHTFCSAGFELGTGKGLFGGKSLIASVAMFGLMGRIHKCYC